ncbi:predicted protein [Naegleria gruberi]|uniref:Predicted protein n=1 Tax=Naegleria gruberi TaxID=5762 RepID=D2V2E5_NAEGR|nr:uncharacterized protein NAEGRDRAFT_62973 [Naegleria gruberi]EFC49043.1 predicted protein [Naegleria gruberi]|eukprot:XP_002681787.1 predicted protein [Naegleria gruberi strain NEG-M]
MSEAVVSTQESQASSLPPSIVVTSSSPNDDIGQVVVDISQVSSDVVDKLEDNHFASPSTLQAVASAMRNELSFKSSRRNSAVEFELNVVPQRKLTLKGTIKPIKHPGVGFLKKSSSLAKVEFHDDPLVEGDERCFLEWKGLQYPLGATNESLHLKNVCGFATPGKITALIGSSNSGKSTLLNILSQRGDFKDFGGQILINGKVVCSCHDKPSIRLTSTQYKSLVAHVPKHFATSHPVLTVREILNFTVKLKLTNIKSAASNCREERLEYLLKKYELKNKENVFYSALGTAEKKRLHIAVQNVLKHRVLLLEYPTDGMEIGEAAHFIRIMKSIALMGVGVVVTSHKPSLKELELFDYISILNKGNQLYFGPPNKLITYFSKIGVSADESNHNEVEFLFQVISLLQTETFETILVEDAQEPLDQSELFATEYIKQLDDFFIPMKNKEENRYLENDPTTFHYEPYYANFFYSVFTLIMRNYLSRLRNWKVEFLIPFVEKIAVSVFIGLLYFQIDPNNMPLKGKIFTFLNLNISLTFSASLKNLINQIPMLTQERNSSIYRTSAFFISKTMEDLIETSIFSLLFGGIVYFMTGLTLEYDRVLIFGLIFATYHWTCVSFAQMLVSLVPIPPLLNLITPVINIMFILTSGVYGIHNTEWLAWFKYLNYLFYGFKAMAINEFDIQLETPLNTTLPSNYYTNGTYFLEKNYGYSDPHYMLWVYLAILTSFWIVCKILSYVGLRLVYGKKSWFRVFKKILRSCRK